MSTWRLGTSGGRSPRRSDARLRRGRPRERGEAVEAQVPSPSLACPLARPREGAEVAPLVKALTDLVLDKNHAMFCISIKSIFRKVFLSQ